MSARALCAIGIVATLGATTDPQPAGTPWSAAQIGALQMRLDAALAAPELRGAHVGLLAIDTVRGSLLYARDADDEFTPASNLKLLVGSAALHDLGPSFRFQTSLSSDAPPHDGVIAGNLYLRGGGDAHLNASDLRDAALSLKRSGIVAIDGSLVTDASHDDEVRYPPGWAWDDLPYEYAAPVTALELEGGVVHVYVTPGASPGDPVGLRIEPSSGAFTVENRAVTGPAGSQDSTDVVRPWDSPLTIRIVGSYPAGAPESDDLEPSAPNPQAYAGDVALQALSSAGITVAGGVRAGITPRSTNLLWRHESVPMAQLLANFWLPSDNLMGELFVKELGVARDGEPGSDANGIAAELAYAQSIGVDPSTLSIADGSGTSAYDRITPRDLVRILQSDWTGPQRAVVLDALPEAGVRGTLADRFSATLLRMRVFAKTGTETHVRALSGFLQTDEHGPVTFSLLLNDWLGDDRPDSAAQLQRIEAALLLPFTER